MGIVNNTRRNKNMYNEYDPNFNSQAMVPVRSAEEPAGKTNKKKSGIGKRLLALALGGVIFGASAAAGFAGVNGLTANRTAEVQTAAEAEERTSLSLTNVSYTDTGAYSQTLGVSDIAEGMMPAMVSITNISVQEVQSWFGMFGGNTKTQETESSGTGIIIGKNDTELLIVTNNHVIEDATQLTVCFVDNEACEANVKGADADNDLAVIAVKLADIKEETAAAIKTAALGDSDSLKVGEQVVAIGNALGYGQSVTTGIVSALGRRIDTADADMIQTDAAINPGNSGGALLNMRGEVVGINSAKFSSTEVEGMGYAISISAALPIIEDLMNRTTREKVAESEAAYLGVTGEEITSSISQAYGIPEGIYLTCVEEGSPLAEAGISAKTVITGFDGIKVTSVTNLENRLEYYAAGESVELTVQVLENGAYVERTVTVTLGSAAEHNSSGSHGWNGWGRN